MYNKFIDGMSFVNKLMKNPNYCFEKLNQINENENI